MNAPSVLLFDYGSGNLRSAQRALEKVGADVTVSADFDADTKAFKPTKEEVRLATLYQNYIDEMVAIGGDFDL